VPQPLAAETLLLNPHVYGHGQRHNEFNVKIMATWLFNSVVHAGVPLLLLLLPPPPRQWVTPAAQSSSLP
jgi:hypothetical protein